MSSTLKGHSRQKLECAQKDTHHWKTKSVEGGKLAGVHLPFAKQGWGTQEKHHFLANVQSLIPPTRHPTNDNEPKPT